MNPDHPGSPWRTVFAWLPTRLTCGSWIWLKPYVRRRRRLKVH